MWIKHFFVCSFLKFYSSLKSQQLQILHLLCLFILEMIEFSIWEAVKKPNKELNTKINKKRTHSLKKNNTQLCTCIVQYYLHISSL